MPSSAWRTSCGACVAPTPTTGARTSTDAFWMMSRAGRVRHLRRGAGAGADAAAVRAAGQFLRTTGRFLLAGDAGIAGRGADGHTRRRAAAADAHRAARGRRVAHAPEGPS